MKARYNGKATNQNKFRKFCKMMILRKGKGTKNWKGNVVGISHTLEVIILSLICLLTIQYT